MFVTLNPDCYRLVGLYSDRVHIIWIAFLTLTDKPTLLLRCTKLFGEEISLDAAFNGDSMPTIRLAHLAAGLYRYTQAMILQ